MWKFPTNVYPSSHALIVLEYFSSLPITYSMMMMILFTLTPRLNDDMQATSTIYIPVRKMTGLCSWAGYY